MNHKGMKQISIAVILLIPIAMNAQISRSEEIEKEIKNAYYRDQRHRSVVDSLYSINASYEEISETSLMVAKDDEENRKIVLPLIDEIISRSDLVIDDSTYRTCYLIIQHGDYSVHQKYIGFVESLYQKHVITPTEFMWFIDRLSVQGQKKQKYGLQSKFLSNGEKLLYPVDSKYRQNWADIGQRYKRKIWKGIDHTIIIEDENTFILCGAIGPSTTFEQSIPIYVNGEVLAMCDKNGYFQINLSKQYYSTIEVSILYKGLKYNYNLKLNDIDFEIINIE